jgi:hypothetical protein
MAQTRNKRKTKHRGNAAGVVESRGRTGRKPTAAEKKGEAASPAERNRQKLIDKRDRPPTWRGAFYKAMIASVLLLLVMLVFIHAATGVAGLFPVILVGYTLVSYYTDKWVYDRRMRKKGTSPKAKSR